MILFDHPIFKHLLPFASLDEGRMNLDFLQLPDQLQTLALDVEVNCVACGTSIKCLRARAKSERSRIGNSVIEHRLYYAPTCPTDVNSGCARTHEARDHKIMFVTALRAQGIRTSV